MVSDRARRGAFVPFLILPAAFGSALTLILVNIFPARRTREILSVITVLAAAGVVLLFRLLRPEQLARPEALSVTRRVSSLLLRTPSSAVRFAERMGARRNPRMAPI